MTNFLIEIIETNWLWFFVVLALGFLAQYFDKMDFFMIFMAALIFAKIVEIQNYHLK